MALADLSAAQRQSFGAATQFIRTVARRNKKSVWGEKAGLIDDMLEANSIKIDDQLKDPSLATDPDPQVPRLGFDEAAQFPKDETDPEFVRLMGLGLSAARTTKAYRSSRQKGGAWVMSLLGAHFFGFSRS